MANKIAMPKGVYKRSNRELGVVVGVLVSTMDGLQLCIHIPEGLRDGDIAYVFPDKDIAKLAASFVDQRNITIVSKDTHDLFDLAAEDIEAIRKMLRERKGYT